MIILLSNEQAYYKNGFPYVYNNIGTKKNILL